jgi:methylenetetrahydrofolate dehydrogenase (NADP+)/methenyltetrahydrofolate cyclohydrolase
MNRAALIDGKAAAAVVRARVAEGVRALGQTPGLAVILVGEDPASEIYVRNKLRAAEEAGIATFPIHMDATVSEEAVLAEVRRLNADATVDGILVQLPLPAQVNTLRVMAAIDPAKDVDGLHAMNAGLLTQGSTALVPCTPKGCLELIKGEVADLTGAHAVVVGASNIVGKPMAALLLAEKATVTMTHIHTRDTRFLCRSAEVLVVGVGVPELVRGDWIKPRAVVIDVGINRITRPDGAKKIVGDVAFDEAVEVAGAITPVPGGVGPMTIACLLENVLIAARVRRAA